MNGYEKLSLLRDNIGEVVAAHWSDKQLLQRINLAQNIVGAKVANAPGDWLLKKSPSITPNSSGQLALPADCLSPAYVEEVDSGVGIPIRGTVREREGGRGGAEAFLIGGYVEVNQSGYATPCYVWYQPRIIDLAAGVVAAGDATHVTMELAMWPNGADDYYNGVTLQVRDASDHKLNVDTIITDYVGATGVAEVASVMATAAAGDFYGTVSSLPVEFHEWVVMKATLMALAKPSSNFEKEIFAFWKSLLKDKEEDMDLLLASRFSGSTYVRVVED